MFWKIWAGVRHLGVLVRIRGECSMMWTAWAIWGRSLSWNEIHAFNATTITVLYGFFSFLAVCKCRICSYM